MTHSTSPFGLRIGRRRAGGDIPLMRACTAVSLTFPTVSSLPRSYAVMSASRIITFVTGVSCSRPASASVLSVAAWRFSRAK